MFAFGNFLLSIFVVGFDQGHLFSSVQGQKAFDTKWLHEFYHRYATRDWISLSLIRYILSRVALLGHCD